jgi:hypothetical protein
MREGRWKELRERQGRWKGVTCIVLAVAFFAGSAAYFVIHGQNTQDTATTATGSDKKSVSSNDDAKGDGGVEVWTALRDMLVSELSPMDSELVLKLQQPSSAEWKALQWMVVTDETRNSAPATTATTIASTNSSLIQRYALAVTYLHFDLVLVAAQHECDWVGVKCRKDDSLVVNALNFTGQALAVGTIPTSLAYLSSSLESLDLSIQQLKGTIPMACYSQWTNLTYLNLEQNQLTQIFTTNNNKSVADAGAWTALQYMIANDNLLDESVPESLSHWTNLRQLDLRGNSGLRGPLLEYVLPYWSAIESIEIAQTGLTGTIPENLSLGQLTSLSASYSPLAGTLPESLATATNLQTLALGLAETTWMGTLPDSYSALTALEFLSLANLKGINGTLPASWGRGLKSVTALDLFGNPSLSGPLPSSWGHMTELVLLRLADTGISGSIPSELGLLTNLVDLTFFRTRLTGSMPHEICDLRTAHVLTKLSVDCANSNPAANDAPVQCSAPDCCTFCTQSTL